MTREEAISKKAVMQVLAELGYGDEENGAEPEYMSALSDVAKEVKAIKALEQKGEWQEVANGAFWMTVQGYRCSNCGKILFQNAHSFCGSCGADMRKESEENNAKCGVDWLGAEHILDAVAKGIPLPKGHGRLIDVNALPNEVQSLYSIRNAPTIIEADKAESEENNAN